MRATAVLAICAGCALGARAFQVTTFHGAGVARASARARAQQFPARPQCSAQTPETDSQMSSPLSRDEMLRRSALALASVVVSGSALPGGAQAAFGGVDAVRARFGDKLRRAAKMFDELQGDLFNEDWDLVQTYPSAFRSLVPIFTKYTDAVFPSDDPVDTNSRVALRYEVGRLFGAVERLKRAADAKDSREAEKAYAAMSVAYDRYLKAGNLYSSYDPVTSTEKFFAGVSNGDLKFVSPSRDPPKIKDTVLMISGPDKGKVGRMIGQESNERTRGGLPLMKAIVKLDTSTSLGGIREIKVVPYEYVAKTVDQPRQTPSGV